MGYCHPARRNGELGAEDSGFVLDKRKEAVEGFEGDHRRGPAGVRKCGKQDERISRTARRAFRIVYWKNAGCNEEVTKMDEVELTNGNGS